MKHTEDKFRNRLADEKSPYLLQHADNPVDWYPWGEAAFAAAKKLDKPVFLSIGYSTCHWCHVMAHESFEDTAVARLMNDAFINIKVDREERPDIDNIYMTVCQMLTGHGGWPLTIVMTPDKRPFYAATYIPKNQRFNRPGMMELIPLIKQAWETDRTRLLASAEQISSALGRVSSQLPGEVLGEDLLEIAFEQLAESYDSAYGGFGSRPKFPTPHNLLFLLRYHQRTGDASALEMVENTLKNIRLGGVFDHIGLGFHRYSTDQKWLLPHFEKMLYDQAMLIIAYSELYQITANAFYRRTAEETIHYVLRDMTDPQGGFYSAEDADSEGEEGKFYVWTTAEIREVLNKNDAGLFIRVFNLDEEGNFAEEATGHKTGANIPHLRAIPEEIAAKMQLSPEALNEKVSDIRQQLYAAREQRIHPLKDDKILTDWNGLMIAALGTAARAFGEEKYAEAARRAADFLLNNMRHDGGLLHRYRGGEAAIDAYLDDYAFLVWGLIELYETVFDPQYLETALLLTDELQEKFWDDAHYGYFFTADSAENLLVRKKEIYDGATPSGNSVMFLNLLKLSRLSGRTELEEIAEKLGRSFSDQVAQVPSGYTMLLCGLDFATRSALEIVIAGKRNTPETRQMIDAVHRRFLPNKVLLFVPTDDTSDRIRKLAPFTENMSTVDNRATAYVCQNFACELPTTDIQHMLTLMTD